MRLAALLLLLISGSALCQQQEIQRALIQRDQQSAEFAAQVRGGRDLQQLEALHAAQLREALIPASPEPTVAAPLLPYQRERMAQDRELRLAPPVVRSDSTTAKSAETLREPLPLPGGPRSGVDPVTPDGIPR
jgi:hypothetical protein